jgi:excisionase family DNA binding protein
MEKDKFLTVDELCKYIKIPKPTIYMLLGKGHIPAAKIGRQWRFNKDSIDEWMKKKEEYYTTRKERRKRL